MLIFILCCISIVVGYIIGSFVLFRRYDYVKRTQRRLLLDLKTRVVYDNMLLDMYQEHSKMSSSTLVNIAKNAESPSKIISMMLMLADGQESLVRELRTKLKELDDTPVMNARMAIEDKFIYYTKSHNGGRQS